MDSGIDGERHPWEAAEEGSHTPIERPGATGPGSTSMRCDFTSQPGQSTVQSGGHRPSWRLSANVETTSKAHRINNFATREPAAVMYSSRSVQADSINSVGYEHQHHRLLQRRSTREVTPSCYDAGLRREHARDERAEHEAPTAGVYEVDLLASQQNAQVQRIENQHLS